MPTANAAIDAERVSTYLTLRNFYEYSFWQSLNFEWSFCVLYEQP